MFIWEYLEVAVYINEGQVKKSFFIEKKKAFENEKRESLELYTNKLKPK